MMSSSGKFKPILAVLIAIVLIAAGVIAVLAYDRSALSDELETQRVRAGGWSAVANMASHIQREVSMIDQATAEGAADLFSEELGGAAANAVLDRTLKASPYIVNVLTTDVDRTIMGILPERYEFINGTVLPEQDPVVEALDSGRPYASDLFMVVEGFSGVTINYPIFDATGAVKGAIVSLFRPDHMLENITSVLYEDQRAMVMQSDGVLLYDPDPSQVGRNTFTDPLFEGFDELKDIAVRMVNETTGNGRYSFSVEGDAISKEIVWSSVNVLNARWTVAVNWEV